MMAKRIEKRTDELVDKPRVKRGRVLPKEGAYCVHVMSRIVDRRFVLGDVEKEHFRKLMRAQACFSGLNIITYALMDNHFHLLVQVPDRASIDDEELYRRMEVARGREALMEFRQLVDRLVAQGSQRAAEAEKQRIKDRMYDLGMFMQQLKRLFTRWFNRRNERTGTLWEARYKSVVVEGSGNPLLTMAAYIDLNAVRAEIVDDPKDYRFCGYGEAVAGSKVARAGLTYLQEAMGRSSDWRMVQRCYRKWIYTAGDSTKGRMARQPFDRKDVKRVWDEDGDLTPFELMQCRVRYFSDGVALGSREFVEQLFVANRQHFGERRRSGARRLEGKPFGGLFSLRDLRLNVIS
jgi:REP element-mobilizing transposase RayT